MPISTTSYYESAGKTETTEQRELPKQDEKLERAKKTVQDFMEESEKYTSKYFKKFRKIFADYMMSRASLYFPAETIHGIQSTLGFQIVESFTPEVVLAFFQEKPYCTTIANNPDYVPVEKDVEDFLGWEADRMDIVSKATIGIKTEVMYGTVIVKTPWVKEVRKFHALDGTMSSKTIYDFPDWDNVNIFNFFPDPNYRLAGDIQGMKGCVHRIFRTMDQIKRLEKKKQEDGTFRGIYENLDKLAAHTKEKGVDSSATSFYDKDSFHGEVSKEDSFGATQTNGHKLDEYWGVFDEDGKGNLVEYVITLADDEVVIRCEMNRLDGQYKPFIGAVNYQIPGEWYGGGEIEPVWSLLTETKVLKQAKLTAVKLATNPVSVVDRTGGFNIKNLVARPGALWVGNDVNAIKPLPISDGFLVAFKEIAGMEVEVQQALAMPTPGAGMMPGGGQIGRTTAGVNFIQSASNKRLMLKVMLNGTMLIKKFFQRMMQLNYQFLPDEVSFRITGKENPFKRVKRDFFQPDWMLDTRVAMDRITKQLRIANIKENVIPLLELNEKANPRSFKWNEFIPDTLVDMEYRTAQAKNYFRPQQEVEAERQQQVMQQQQLAERNIQAQTEAQAALGQQKAQGEIIQRQMMDEATLKKTALKGAMEAERSEKQTEANMSGSVINEIVKVVMEGVKHGES